MINIFGKKMLLQFEHMIFYRILGPILQIDLQIFPYSWVAFHISKFKSIVSFYLNKIFLIYEVWLKWWMAKNQKETLLITSKVRFLEVRDW